MNAGANSHLRNNPASLTRACSLKPNTIPIVLNPFSASGSFAHEARLPLATGKGLLSISFTPCCSPVTLSAS